MDHSAALLETLAIGLVAAFIGGIVATKLRLPTIVGYLVAGVFVGPFTPGLVADTGTAQELAELGVILLMFGVGIHFSVGDLLAVRSTAIPGAIGQILVATLLGIGLGIALGWGFAGGLVLGLAVSVASTIVLLRALEARDEVDSPQGRIAVGWLIVEDLFTVLVLVLLPSLAPMLLGQGGDTGGVVLDLVVALAKLGAFAALMLVVGVRVVPRLLLWVKDTGSRELFTLSVLAVAIGIAVAAYAVFGVSFALGAFLAGVVLNESEISHQAAEDALPLRDAFAVLFFVSVGMLFDPAFLARQPGAIILVTLLVVVAKSLAAFAIVVLLRRPLRVALTVGAALSQVGEFSFILATLGLSLALIPEDAFQLVVAAALVSITLNPFLFRLIGPLEAAIRSRPGLLRVLDGWTGPIRRATAGGGVTSRIGRVTETRMYPLLPCRDIDEAIAFYEALGFTRTSRQVRPNPHAVVERGELAVHLFGMDGFDPADSYGERDHHRARSRRPVRGLRRRPAGGVRAPPGRWDPADGPAAQALGHRVRLQRRRRRRQLAADLEDRRPRGCALTPPSPASAGSIEVAARLADAKGDDAQALKTLGRRPGAQPRRTGPGAWPGAAVPRGAGVPARPARPMRASRSGPPKPWTSIRRSGPRSPTTSPTSPSCSTPPADPPSGSAPQPAPSL